MIKRTAVILSAATLSFGLALAPAFAEDTMKKDTMSKDSMSKDSMKKDSTGDGQPPPATRWDGKRGVGHRPQATAPILDSTTSDINISFYGSEAGFRPINVLVLADTMLLPDHEGGP